MTDHGRPVTEMTEADLEALLDDRLARVSVAGPPTRPARCETPVARLYPTRGHDLRLRTARRIWMTDLTLIVDSATILEAVSLRSSRPAR